VTQALVATAFIDDQARAALFGFQPQLCILSTCINKPDKPFDNNYLTVGSEFVLLTQKNSAFEQIFIQADLAMCCG
jgi:hypothetical protein